MARLKRGKCRRTGAANNTVGEHLGQAGRNFPYRKRRKLIPKQGSAQLSAAEEGKDP